MKNSLKVYSILLGLILLPLGVFAQNRMAGNPLWKIRSFDMVLSNRGFAFGGTWRHNWSREWASPVQAQALFFREPDKIPYYDPYTGYYYEPPSKKIVFFTARTGIQRRLWTHSLAENMQPYLMAMAGPTIALNPANSGGFFSRWKKTNLSATANAFAGFGVDFVYSRHNQFSLTIGYEAIYFPWVVDGSHNYSGIALGLSFGERQ